MTTIAAPTTFTVPTGNRAALHAFGSLLLRDVRVLRRNFKQFVLRTVMQPLLFAFVFNYVFPKIGQGIGGPSGSGTNFGTVLVPGLIAVAVIFQGIQSVALPLVQEFSYTREIEDRVLAPLPVWAVGLGKMTNGAVQAILAALVVFPIVAIVHAPGTAPDIHIPNYLTFAVVLVSAAFLGSAVGLTIGTTFAPQQVPLIFSIIVMPMSMLGCIYYPWAQLDSIGWLKIGVLFNPLVYMSEGLRAAMTPDVPHMNTALVVSAMLAMTLALGALALRKFHQRVVS